MKKYLFVFLFLIALLTSCNLDNQGIFAEVLDRVPSDNRRLSLIGEYNRDIYFSSINGIEKYNLDSGTYTTIDSSSEAKKSNRFIFDGNKIIYFVESANHSTVKYDGYYLLNLSDGSKTLLDGSANSYIYSSSFKKHLITKEGKIVTPSVDAQNKLYFTSVIDAPSGTRFVKNIDDILIYTTDLTSSSPSNSSLEYYYFNGTSLTQITKAEADMGTLRSVASIDSNNKILVFSKSNVGTTAYKLGSDNKLVAYHKINSSTVSKDFASFVDGNNFYYVYDGSSNFNKLNLSSPAVTSTTISKISTVSIVGYFKLSDGVYKICTSNNGFFTLTLGDIPTIK